MKLTFFDPASQGLRFVEPATQLGPPYSVFTQRSYTVEVSFNFEALQYFLQQATPGPSGEARRRACENQMESHKEEFNGK